MTVIRRFALIITWVGCASPNPGWKMDRGEADASEERKMAACATALDAVFPEAEKSYRAALSAPTRGERRAALPVESTSARRALTELEQALAQAPAADSLHTSARRFASAAEALLLRAREPARRSGDGGLEPGASLQALLATHELFQDAAAHLRMEVAHAVRSRALLEAMRGNREWPSAVKQ